MDVKQPVPANTDTKTKTEEPADPTCFVCKKRADPKHALFRLECEKSHVFYVHGTCMRCPCCVTSAQSVSAEQKQAAELALARAKAEAVKKTQSIMGRLLAVPTYSSEQLAEFAQKQHDVHNIASHASRPGRMVLSVMPSNNDSAAAPAPSNQKRSKKPQ